jgi:hypothetical protein
MTLLAFLCRILVRVNTAAALHIVISISFSLCYSIVAYPLYGSSYNASNDIINGLPTKIIFPTTLQRPTIRFSVAQPQAWKSGVNPTVQLLSVSLAKTTPTPVPIVEQLGSKGLCQVVFDKPLTEGTYQLSITYKSDSGSDTRICTIEVYSGTVSDETLKSINAIKPRFGERFTVSLPPSFDLLPMREYLFWSYSLGADQKEDVAFTETFRSPLIPGIARTVTLELTWKHPQTGERFILAGTKAETEQLPPPFFGEAMVDVAPPPQPGKKSKNALRPNEAEFVINNLGIKYKIPVDVDERQSPPAVIYAEPTDITVTEMTLDLADKRTELIIQKEAPPQDKQAPVPQGYGCLTCTPGFVPDPKAPFTASPQNISVTPSALLSKEHDAIFLTLTVRLKNIPVFTDKKPRIMRGLVFVSIKATVTNRKASKIAQNQITVPVPFQIALQ